MEAYQSVAVDSTTYPTTAQVAYGWETDSIMVVVQSTTATDLVYVSFDGKNDAGVLRPGLVPALSWQTKRTRVFLRLGPAAANPTSVDVMANTVR